MRIVEVDAFYLAMPGIAPIPDGTQDTFLVRLRADNGLEAWGESDASPLVSLACYCCPPSHSNIVNLRDSLLGARLDSVEDLHAVRAATLRRALDIQHVHHAFSAADIALWDLLGQRLQMPVYALLDGAGASAFPKRPYASSLFGDDPDATRARAVETRAAGFDAAKFGWGPLGSGDRMLDLALVGAAREGLGDGPQLFVDAGWAWGDDVETAAGRARDFLEFGVGWLEEPLQPEAVEAYAALAERRPRTAIAAGESSGRLRDAYDFILNGHLDVVQIDAGRIGGITPAHQVRQLAERTGITYLNHTFKSHLSLAAALHVFATVECFELVEYAVGGAPLAAELVVDPLTRGPDGRVPIRDTPGLGVTVDLETVRRYLRPVEIFVDGAALELNTQLV
jgi:L-alanine-DL-glutamate epimerase-like enolase superfamily enzyme